MVYCAKSKTAKKRTWCKKTPCAVDSDNKSCILDGKTNRCRARISKKALPKKKSSKIIKKTKKTEEVAEVLPAPPLRRSARLNTAKGGAPPPKPMSKKASRAKVFNNKDLVTPGGLSTKDLVKSNGRIVSKVKSKIGKKNSWALAVKKARKELKIDGFAVIKKGEPIYDLAMKYYKGSVGGSDGQGVTQTPAGRADTTPGPAAPDGTVPAAPPAEEDDGDKSERKNEGDDDESERKNEGDDESERKNEGDDDESERKIEDSSSAAPAARNVMAVGAVGANTWNVERFTSEKDCANTMKGMKGKNQASDNP